MRVLLKLYHELTIVMAQYCKENLCSLLLKKSFRCVKTLTAHYCAICFFCKYTSDPLNISFILLVDFASSYMYYCVYCMLQMVYIIQNVSITLYDDGVLRQGMPICFKSSPPLNFTSYFSD